MSVLVVQRLQPLALLGLLLLNFGCSASVPHTPQEVSCCQTPRAAYARLHATVSPPNAESEADVLTAQADVAASVEDTPTPKREQLRELVRRGAWDGVALLLPELDDPTRFEAYLNAKVALELGYYDAAIERYRALPPLPELEDTIEAELRRALARAGRFDELSVRARILVDGEDWLYAAEKLLAEGRPSEAGKAIESAARAIRGSGDLAARLRQVRARWAFGKGQRYRAFMDWRWLVERAPSSAASDEALERLSSEFPHFRLSAEDWRRRAASLADAGLPELIPRQLDGWRQARGRKATPAEEAHYLGWAYFRARDYGRATHHLLDSATSGGAYARHDRYYAARSLSRLGRTNEAIEHYQVLLKTAPKSRTGHNAAFRIAREHSFLGDWASASAAYTRFLNAHQGSDFTESALRERAVARYAAGEFELAAREFKSLRYKNPRSQFSGLYQLLEALSLLATPDGANAVGLFEAVATQRPFSFEGMAARARLQRLARSLPALTPTATPSAAKPELPAGVDSLDNLGLFEHAEHLLRSQEHELSKLPELGSLEAKCKAYSQLFAGRRRFLLGLEAARRSNFYGSPNDAPEWVWRCVHPNPFRDWVSKGATEFDVPESLIFAVMRQESGFRPSVVSPANAHGLMQVIPPTAREIAIALGDLVPEQDASLLDFKSPHVNVRYGSYYLGRLLREFGEHPALAAAGYNAGPEAARLWYRAGRELPLELFVARIPFDETRRYVMNVLLNLEVYNALSEQPPMPVPLSFR